MTETKSALDEIKGIESQARKMSLIEIISDLKNKAKEIKRLKHYTDSILKEMGYDAKDIKSIIDYVNSQVSIDEKEIEKDAKKDLERKKDNVVQKMKNEPKNWFSNIGYTTTSNLVSNTPIVTYTSGTGCEPKGFGHGAVSCVSKSDLELIDSL